MVINKNDVLGLLAFILGLEAIAAAFELDQQPERSDALSPPKRAGRIAELGERLFEFEQREECLILQAAQEGIDILRRSDADVRAVLNVVVVAKEAQPSAA